MSDRPLLPPPHGPQMTPAPSSEEAVAILAAVEALWPRPVVVESEPTAPSRAWRFSGRWWNRPVAARRDRPWR